MESKYTQITECDFKPLIYILVRYTQ